MAYKIFSIALKEKQWILENVAISWDYGVIMRNYVENMYLLRSEPVTNVPPVKGA
jgi:hypothetical protein